MLVKNNSGFINYSNVLQKNIFKIKYVEFDSDNEQVDTLKLGIDLAPFNNL